VYARRSLVKRALIFLSRVILRKFEQHLLPISSSFPLANQLKMDQAVKALIISSDIVEEVKMFPTPPNASLWRTPFDHPAPPEIPCGQSSHLASIQLRMCIADKPCFSTGNPPVSPIKVIGLMTSACKIMALVKKS